MRQIYIVGDVGDIYGPLSFYDAETHEELVLKEAQITLISGKAPTIDFLGITPGSTERRARLVPAPVHIPSSPIPDVEDKQDETCRHTGWVSHDVQGDNRFWCRECDERFINHPLVVKKTPPLSPAITCSSCGHEYRSYCPRCHVIKYKSSSKKKKIPPLPF